LRIVEKGEGPNPDEFRIPASDTKGHSARLWFRAIPAMARQMEQVVQSKAFPYRTKGDLLRHALHRHMSWLGRQDDITSVSGQVDVILEIMRDEEANNDFQAVFSRLGERVTQHLTRGSTREAQRLILTVKRHIDRMPEGFWKDRYKEELMDRYGELANGGTRANLGDMK